MDDNQLSHDARGAYQFIQTPYGERLIQRLVELHSGLHEQAEGDSISIEQKAVLVTKAAGIKQCLDIILKEAALVSSGELERMEHLDKMEKEIPA